MIFIVEYVCVCGCVYTISVKSIARICHGRFSILIRILCCREPAPFFQLLIQNLFNTTSIPSGRVEKRNEFHNEFENGCPFQNGRHGTSCLCRYLDCCHSPHSQQALQNMHHTPSLIVLVGFYFLLHFILFGTILFFSLFLCFMTMLYCIICIHCNLY